MLPLVSTRCVMSTGHVAVGIAREQLAADGVAHVVGEQRELAQAELGGERGDDVGLRGERVRDVGLRGEAVPEEVEQADAPVRAQAVEHEVEVERRGREAVEDQERLVALLAERRRVDGEDPVAGELPVGAELLPCVEIGHV